MWRRLLLLSALAALAAPVGAFARPLTPTEHRAVDVAISYWGRPACAGQIDLEIVRSQVDPGVSDWGVRRSDGMRAWCRVRLSDRIPAPRFYWLCWTVAHEYGHLHYFKGNKIHSPDPANIMYAGPEGPAAIFRPCDREYRRLHRKAYCRSLRHRARHVKRRKLRVLRRRWRRHCRPR